MLCVATHSWLAVNEQTEKKIRIFLLLYLPVVLYTVKLRRFLSLLRIIVWKKNLFFLSVALIYHIVTSSNFVDPFFLHPAILYEQFGWHEFIEIVSNFRLCLLLFQRLPFILILFRFISATSQFSLELYSNKWAFFKCAFLCPWSFRLPTKQSMQKEFFNLKQFRNIYRSRYTQTKHSQRNRIPSWKLINSIYLESLVRNQQL